MSLLDYFMVDNENVPVLPMNEGLHPWKMIRTFYLTYNKEFCFIKYQMNNLSDINRDNLCTIDKKYELRAPGEIIDKYVILNGSLVMKSINNVNGYFWVCIGDKEVFNYKELKNKWGAQLMKSKDGVRVIYINPEYNLCSLNLTKNEYWIYIYSDTEITGEFEIKITKNINIVPLDNELFVLEKNKNTNMKLLNNLNKKGLITNATSKENVI